MYKCLAAGDLHLRKSAPAMRVDDFLAAQERKLNEILDIAEEQGAMAVIFPGDVFDRADAPHGLVEQAIRWFGSRPLRYLFVFGQHDLRYHTSDKQNTPLGVLCTALGDQARILSPKNPYRVSRGHTNAVFYGCSWGEPLPDEMEEADHRIVVMHRPISDKPLPWDHPDFLLARDLVKKCPADIFITGDNHAQFIERSRSASVINMGSVMRTTTAQVEHEPAVAIVELDGSEVALDIRKIQIRKNVFDLEQVQAKLQKEERIAAFVTGLQGSFNPELKFIDNLQAMAKNSPAGVQGIISEVLQ